MVRDFCHFWRVSGKRGHDGCRFSEDRRVTCDICSVAVRRVVLVAEMLEAKTNPGIPSKFLIQCVSIVQIHLSISPFKNFFRLKQSKRGRQSGDVVWSALPQTSTSPILAEDLYIYIKDSITCIAQSTIVPSQLDSPAAVRLL
jgi:hypothetical protein